MVKSGFDLDEMKDEMKKVCHDLYDSENDKVKKQYLIPDQDEITVRTSILDKIVNPDMKKSIALDMVSYIVSVNGKTLVDII